MLKIFRNIRQKLAAENNVAKNLRYAIGEILLVVIGILIALQINNWNQERRNATIEEQIMPYLNDNISFKNLDKYSPMKWKHQSEFKTDYNLIFSDRKFESLVDNHLYHLSILKDEHKLIEQIMDIIVNETKL